MAVDVSTFPIVFDEFHLSSSELDAWRIQRSAAVLGAGLAEHLGWKKGDRVVLVGTIPPYLKLEFHVVGITRASAYPNVFVFRLDYLLDSFRSNSMMPPDYSSSVNIFWVRAKSPESLSAVRSAIDASFANSPDPTRTELEEAFVAQFTKMFGDIPSIVRDVGLVVVASILLIVCNTLSSSVRERIGELAILKAMGFTTVHLIKLLLAESLLMGLMGCLGCVTALLAFGLSDASGLSMPYFPIVSVSPAVTAIGACISLLISCAAVIPSAFRVARLSVTTTLRETR